MNDNDPRLDVLRQWLPTMPTPSRPVLLRRLDATDLERGIVRVDTNDKRTVALIANAVFDWWEDQPDQGWDGAAEAILTAIREATR